MKLKASQNDQSTAENSVSGGKAFAFWTMVWLIFVLTIGNLILTVTIIGVLKFGRGLEFLELVPEGNIVKFFGSVDMDKILLKKDGVIEGFYDVPLSITGEKSDLQLSLMKDNGLVHNRMLMSKNGTQFTGVNRFELRDDKTNEILFTTHDPTYNLPTGTEQLHATSVSTQRLTSAIDHDLVVNNTRGKILFRGSEGIELNSKDGVLTADQLLQFKTENGSIYLISNTGIYLDMKNIPIVEEHDGIKMESNQYKICVCMPQGKLFRVAVPNTKHNGFGIRDLCNHHHLKFDPCM